MDEDDSPVRVLVVDDEAGVRSALRRGLAAEGMEVTACAEGAEALRLGSTGAFDVILLDALLPGESGYRVLERLRERGTTTPVLMVASGEDDLDRADGSAPEADGYVVRPFSVVALAGRVRALVRGSGTPGEGDVLRVGALEIDRAGRKVRWAGEPIALSPREYKLLLALAGRPGTVLAEEDLLREVWGADQDVTSDVVEVYIGYLRRKLDAVGAGELVRTVEGRGYRVGEA
ncbi:DNA-binding response OmpR family regulator [Actinopolyspora biskrensis]|uniref:DNA-binding response OmpR family regulator n=1 Tax=Actinopolyspora biskrensis TaxID=1470178 RepID=A0A852Z0U5_9ACTN|nr:DNA-binding response OmpR family regulator [Actinopolyspora biskrensis]